ncbi:MAG: ATP-binding protein [Bacteroidota bacterium]|nr:ATP-binding protein [Bacteroidota bacterium]
MADEQTFLKENLSGELKKLLLEKVVNIPSKIGIFILDTNYNYILFNKTYRYYIKTIFDIDIKIGDNYLDTFAGHSDIAKEKATLAQAFSGIKFNQVGHYYFNNKKYYYKDSYKPIIDSEGKSQALVVYYSNITSKKKSELTWNALLNISSKANETDELAVFVEEVRNELSKIVDTGNFFVALYDEEKERYTFPYFIDESDDINTLKFYDLRNSATDFVRRSEKPLNLNDKIAQHLQKKQEIKLIGTHSPSWLGIPLKTNAGVIGVLVIQNYELENRYSEEDIEILTIISRHIAHSIEKKQAKQELRETAGYLKHAVKIANLGQVKISIPTGMVKISEEAREIIGLDNDTATISLEEFFSHVFVKDQKGVKSFLQSVQEHGQIYEYNFKFVHNKTKALVYISSKAEVGPFEYYDDLQVDLLIQDVSLQHKKQTELKEAKEAAEKSDKLKSVFLSNISHEIRTPMNAVLGFSEFLTAKDVAQEQVNKYAEYISSSAKDLLHIVNDILDTAKIEAGELKIHKESFDLHKLLWEVKVMFESIAKKHNIDFQLKKVVDAESLYIFSDRVRLKQILINLLNNAFKFIRSGHIHFGYLVKEANIIDFFVEDTGSGIPEGKKDLIFSRFGQILEEGVMHPGGTGLGLSITKNLVENLGGKIDFTSTEGKGTTFFFSLPYDMKNTEQESNGEFTLMPGKIVEKNILIVDSSKLNRRILKRLFDKHMSGNEFTYINSAGAEKYLEKNSPHLMIINLGNSMKEKVGIIRNVRSQMSETDTMPIIALTRVITDSVKEMALAEGINKVIPKPYNYESIIREVAEVFA